MDASIRAEGATWHPTLKLHDLPVDGTGCTFEVAGRTVALFRIGERVHACDDTCPHAGASLGSGVVAEGDVTCPWHSFHFDLETGRNTDGLDVEVRVFATRVDSEGTIEIGLPPV